MGSSLYDLLGEIIEDLIHDIEFPEDCLDTESDLFDNQTITLCL